MYVSPADIPERRGRRCFQCPAPPLDSCHYSAWWEEELNSGSAASPPSAGCFHFAVDPGYTELAAPSAGENTLTPSK